MLPQPGASRLLVSTTPGSSFSMPAKSRPLSAMSSMFSRVIRPERAAVVVCTSDASACTRHRFCDAADFERDRRAAPTRSVDAERRCPSVRRS